MRHLILLCLVCIIVSNSNPSVGQVLSWSSTQGPFATVVNDLNISGGSYFAGTNIGLFTSTDGSSWVTVPSVPGIVYDIATKGNTVYVAGAGGITISTDAGATWAVRDTGLPQFPLVYSITNVHDTLYACLGGEGFYFSPDNGLHWTLPANEALGKSVYTMISTGTSLIFAEGAGILRSIDNGFSWMEPAGTIADQVIHAFALKGKNIYAGTDDGVFVSTDDGQTWNRSGTGMSKNDLVTSLCITSDQKSILAGTRNPGNDGGIYRSSDDGNTWQLVNSGLSSLSINAVFASNSFIFAGTSVGIARTSNTGTSWQTVSDGLPKPAVLSLGTNNYTVYAGTTGSYLFTTDDKGDHWAQHKSGITQKNVTAVTALGSSVFAGTNAVPKQNLGGVHHSTDNGTTWIQSNTGIPIMSVSALVHLENEIFVCGDSGVFSTTDDGKSWVAGPAINADGAYSDDTALYVLQEKTIWGYRKNVGWTAPVHFTQNIHGLTKQGIYAFAATDSGVYRDSSGAWKLMTGDSLVVLSIWSNQYLMAAGTTKGIYLSSDGGLSWQFQQSAGIVQVNAFTAANRNIYAATSTGVIKAALGQFGVHDAPVSAPLSLAVTNPSSNQAIIQYTLSRRNNTSISIYDMLGKANFQLANGIQDAGEYTLQWNTSSVPNGSYVLRLVSGDEQATAIIHVIH